MISQIAKNIKSEQGVTLLLSILIMGSVLAISLSVATILLTEIKTSGDLLTTESVYQGSLAVAEEKLFTIKRNVPAASTTPTSQLNVKVTVDTPVIRSTSTPIIQVKVPVSTYMFESALEIPVYNPENTIGGSGYGKIKLTYLNTGASHNIRVYLCQYDPNIGLYFLAGNTSPSSACTSSNLSYGYWPFSYQDLSPGSVMEQIIDSTKQQKIFIYNLVSATSDAYVQIQSFDQDEITPKGLPYSGFKTVEVNSRSGDISRKIQLVIPSASLQTGSLGSGTGFSYFRSITVNGGQVSSGPLANFPVLVNYTDATLRSAPNGGNVQEPSGKDIAFFSDSAGANLLPFELEKYDPVTGNVVAWVKLANLDNGSIFYMLYGKSGADDVSSRTAVWNSSYKGVYHATENPTASGSVLSDSTANAFDLVTTTTSGSPGTTSGKIGNAVNFPAPNQYFGTKAVSSTNSLVGVGNRTMSGWFNFNNLLTFDSGNNALLSIGSQAGWFPNSGDYITITNSGTMRYEIFSSWSSYSTVSSSSIVPGSWYYVTATYDNTNLRFYINGNLVSILSAPGLAFSDYPFGISSAWGYGRFNDVKFDEIRISNIARSPGWITTEYNNQSSPSSFYTVGPQMP